MTDPNDPDFVPIYDDNPPQRQLRYPSSPHVPSPQSFDLSAQKTIEQAKRSQVPLPTRTAAD